MRLDDVVKQQSIRKSQQCVSNTLKEQRCRKRTAHTPKCWIHLAKQNNLRIKPSNIPSAGKGLFAWKKSIPRNTLISKYTGRKISKKELDRKYDYVPTMLFVINEVVVLTQHTQRMQWHVL